MCRVLHLTGQLRYICTRNEVCKVKYLKKRNFSPNTFQIFVFICFLQNEFLAKIFCERILYSIFLLEPQRDRRERASVANFCCAGSHQNLVIIIFFLPASKSIFFTRKFLAQFFTRQLSSTDDGESHPRVFEIICKLGGRIARIFYFKLFFTFVRSRQQPRIFSIECHKQKCNRSD